MYQISVIVLSPTGLHAGPARQLVQEAKRYPCRVAIRIRGREFDAKSMIGILGAGVSCGDRIEIVCRGAEEKKACEALAKLAGMDMDREQIAQICGERAE